MPLFRYRAFSRKGEKISGIIDADSYALAKEKLLKQGILLTSLVAIETGQKEIVLERPVLLTFTRDLAQLLRAGLPLYEALVTIEEKYRGTKAHPVFLDLCDSLKSGCSLSSVLKKYPKTFETIYLSMVSAGEQTASLAEVFQQLSLLISRQQKLKKQLFSALAYPCFLGVFCLLVVSGLFFFIVPSMQELFEGRTLHPITYCVTHISQWLNAHVMALGFSILTFVVIGALLLRQKKTRLLLQTLYIKVPFIRSLMITSGLIRFCQANAMLLDGGVPLVESLHLSKKVIKQALLEEAIEKAEKKMIEGQPLSAQFKQYPFIPPLLPRMLATAEETGNMPLMMRNLAEIFEEELEKNLAYLTTFLQPALLIFLGAVVGLVVLSILLPLTDVSSFLSQ